jgi:hypothetical protein
MNHRPTPDEHEAKMKARWKIIQICNLHKVKSRFALHHRPTLYGMKQVERAVFYGRQHMILPGKLLIEAGFAARAAKPNKPRVLKKLLGHE